ncbi:MAG TPA: RDD family protein [Acidimicrobiales bacterium]|nr:RDD family protein [Acidimicrobiales bacterium]
MPTFDPRQVFRRRLTEPMEQLAQAVAERIVQLVVTAIDVNAVLERVDLERLIDRIDLNELVASVDLDQVARQIDVERIVERVDVEALVARIDIDALVARIDIERLVQRIDVNRLVDQIDVSKLVSQTDLGRVLAASTTGVVTGVLDLVRSHVAGLDQWIERVVTKVFHGRAGRPPGPGWPAEAAGPREPHQRRYERDLALQGRYAGPVSRLAAAAADTAASVGIFNLLLAAVAFAWRVATGHDVSFSHHPAVVDPIFGVWALLYAAYPWALSGKTLGMAVLGIRVVTPDGGRVRPWQAVVRALALPFSVALGGLGLVGVVVQRERRGLHDFVAGTVVVYAWNARAAQLRAIAGTGVAPAA